MTSPRDASPTGTSNLLSSNSPLHQILVVFGTRPEAIKLCPLILAMRRSAELDVSVCITGQHRDMLAPILDVFGVIPDINLDVMRVGQTLPQLTARLLAALEPVFSTMPRPALTVVQGDTSSTLCGALASFYARVPVAHVEAGLRTYDLDAPFPEEMNRRFTSTLASLHFAATTWAAGNLRREGVPDERIEVTGNTGIDALLEVSLALDRGELSGCNLPLDPRKRIILVTAHRRENFGRLSEVCGAAVDLSSGKKVQVVWPVHRNPQVEGMVRPLLSGVANIVLTPPLDYVPFVDLMRRADIILTDSGGIQEEAPSLGKPVLVLREKTERPEAIEAGTVRLVGTDRETIVREASRLLREPSEYQRVARTNNPYGDGRSSGRIVQRIVAYLNQRRTIVL